MTSPRRRHPLELRVPPPVVAAAAAVTQALITRGSPPPTKARRALAATLLVLSPVIGVRGLAAFRTAGTTFHPDRPEAATSLVTTGIYSHTRNPMYAAMALGLLGIAVDRGRLIALVPVLAYAAFLQRFQIRPEEEALHTLFGKDYEAYTRRVRRWV